MIEPIQFHEGGSCMKRNLSMIMNDTFNLEFIHEHDLSFEEQIPSMLS